MSQTFDYVSRDCGSPLLAWFFVRSFQGPLGQTHIPTSPEVGGAH